MSCEGDFHCYAFHDTGFVEAVSTSSARDAAGVPTAGKLFKIRSGESNGRKLFADPVIRRILIEFHCVFDQCQSRVKREGKLDNDQTLEFSRMYRSILRSNANVENVDDPHLRDFALWGIYETMFLQRGDNSIVMDLVKWAHESFIFVHEVAKIAAVEYEQGVALHEGTYWKAVALTLICWRLDHCIEFLRYIKNDTPTQLFIEQLQEFDMAWLSDETKVMKFKEWQTRMQKLIQEKRFAANMNIHVLARMLIGDEFVLKRMAEAALSEWWHMMPFYVLVAHTAVPYNRLGPVAEECRALFKKETSDEDDFDPFFAVFNLGDVSVLQHLVENPWLSLHLVDTMYSCESYDQPIHAVRKNLLESYGANLFVNSNLWEVGAAYLLETGAEGKLRLEGLISAMPIEDEATAEKLYKLCIDNDLEEARSCVINTMTNSNLRAGAWAQALNWALRGGQRKTLDRAVNTIVWKATEKETSGMFMLDHLGDSLLLSPSLSFLFNYYRYFNTLNEGDVAGASEILMNLVTSPDVPSNFHTKLFTQLCAILRCSNVTMQRDTIYELISFFRQYSIDHTGKKEDEYEMLKTIKQLLILRLRDSILG